MQMKERPILAPLMKTPLFEGIEAQALTALLETLNPRAKRYGAEEMVVNAGDGFDGMGVVLSGELLLTKDSVGGERSILNLLRPGEMFGEMVSFLDVKKWPATVTARVESDVLFISPERVLLCRDTLAPAQRQFIENMMRLMARKALGLNRKVEYLCIRTLRGKLAAYLLEQQRLAGTSIFTVPMNRDALADYFNAARPSLSRELSHMKRDGLIDFHKSAFKILDEVRLRASI